MTVVMLMVGSWRGSVVGGQQDQLGAHLVT